MKQCASVKASDASRRRQSRYWRARERNSQEPVNSAGLSRVAWCRCYSASAGCWDSLKFGPVSHLGLCHVVADPIAAPPRSRPLDEEESNGCIAVGLSSPLGCAGGRAGAIGKVGRNARGRRRRVEIGRKALVILVGRNGKYTARGAEGETAKAPNTANSPRTCRASSNPQSCGQQGSCWARKHGLSMPSYTLAFTGQLGMETH